MNAATVGIAGHFGEFVQGRLGPGGPLALVTLPCPVLRLTARHWPGTGLALHRRPAFGLTPRAARRFLADLGATLRGRVVLRAEMPPGGGAGASTAALVALARLACPEAAPTRVARACLGAEGASDPLMFDRPDRLLWASREARIIAELPPVPRFEIVGGFCGPHRRTDPADTAFPDIADLIAPWRRAAAAGDAAELAAIAAQSARRTLALRGPAADPTPALARELGALGFVIAHTGSARGLLFRPGTVPAQARARLVAAGFRGVLRFCAGGAG